MHCWMYTLTFFILITFFKIKEKYFLCLCMCDVGEWCALV